MFCVSISLNVLLCNLACLNFVFQTACHGNLSLSKVTFRYPTRRRYKVLHNFDMTIESGQTVAFVGASGCGKTTLVSLFARFYDATLGSVVSMVLLKTSI